MNAPDPENLPGPNPWYLRGAPKPFPRFHFGRLVPDACIFQCRQDGVTKIAYEATEHFLVTRDFLSYPERSLRVLLER